MFILIFGINKLTDYDFSKQKHCTLLITAKGKLQQC